MTNLERFTRTINWEIPTVLRIVPSRSKISFAAIPRTPIPQAGGGVFAFFTD